MFAAQTALLHVCVATCYAAQLIAAERLLAYEKAAPCAILLAASARWGVGSTMHDPFVKRNWRPPDAEASKEISRLRSEVEELRQAIDARDRNLAIVAHDLRNPLAIISQTAHVLLQALQDAQSSRHVQRIAEAAGRSIDLVENLLDATAIQEGKLSIEKRWTDLSKVVLAVMASQQALAARDSIITSIDLSPDMPRLEADDGRIREVLENLIGNALKFTSPGGTVTVGTRMEAAQALVWVADTGQGIAEEDLPRLFDRFWQARKTDRRGAGLGLGICKAIVEAHGGRIWIESAVGRGTTVYFTLRGSSLPAETSATQANILLVDDIPENLTVLQTILERPDYRFLLARSGTEGLHREPARSVDARSALLSCALRGPEPRAVYLRALHVARCRS